MALGLGMRLGLQAAFKEVNDAGGVHGRRIELIGAVGTPTSAASQPIAKLAGVPFIGPFTGTGFLRDPDNSHVINVRGSYDQETEALLRIRKGDPDAIVMVGSYKPIAEFVKLAKKLKVEADMMSISFVGSKALAAELGSAGEGVVVTQIVLFYTDTSLPVVSDYQNALKALDATAVTGFVSLEGYLTGRLFAAALEKAGPDLSRDQLLSVFQQAVTFDFGGAVLGYGPGDNQGMDKVYLSILQKDGTFAYVDKLSKTVDTAELP